MLERELTRSWSAVASWREGLPPEATEALRPLGEHQVIAFGILAPGSASWEDLVEGCSRLQKTHERLGSPEFFGETQELYASANELMLGGMNFEHALETAYARSQGLPAPASGGSSLREEQNHVAVGPIRLRRRRT